MMMCYDRDLLKEVDGLKERQTMCQETIQAKDAVIVSLSDQLDKLTTGTSVGDPSDPPTNLINLEESFHESVKVSGSALTEITVICFLIK